MQKYFKGSALVYTLIMMMLLLVSALALATTTLVQQRSMAGSGDSVRAFQTANDGFEDMVAYYKKNPSGTVGSSGTSCDSTTGAVTKEVAGLPGKTYVATFFKDSTQLLCSASISEATEIKVVANSGSATRAIETAFAATGTPLQQPCGSVLYPAAANLYSGCAVGKNVAWQNDHCLYSYYALMNNTVYGWVMTCYKNELTSY